MTKMNKEILQLKEQIKGTITMLMKELDKKELEIKRLERIIKMYDREWENNVKH